MGTAFTVTVKLVLLLTQPVVLFVTVKVPVYVPAAVPPGIKIEIGLDVKDALVTLVNAELHVILYWSGEPVVAE